MRSVFITGSSGFIGSNLIDVLSPKYNIIKYEKGSQIQIDTEIVIHLAGKAHDLRNSFNPNEYYLVNTDFTIEVFDKFLSSSAKTFIFISSVKAVADKLDSVLTEDQIPFPTTDYGKSKLNAEKYILSKELPYNKRVFILRPCMVHGSGNKGNLIALYKFIKYGLPWPLGVYENKRSFCSIINFSFIINELIENEEITSGVYNISDDDPLSTNDLIKLIAESKGKNAIIWKIPKFYFSFIIKICDIFHFPLNTERFEKLTENFVVSNSKIKNAIKKKLPLTTKQGLELTFKTFLK